MANQQDRKKPRALTIPEMWISWDLMLDNPVPQSRLLDGTLGKDSLPSAALNEERGHSDRRLDRYPIIRTDYDLQYNHVLIDHQNQRALRLHIIRDILLLPFDPVHLVSAILLRFSLRLLWACYHRDDFQSIDLSGKLANAEMAMGKADQKYNRKDYQGALTGYETAWCNLLPYHLDAFPAGQSFRLQLAAMECKLFNNMMATILEWTKSDNFWSGRVTKLDLLHIGLRAGMAILGICFGMSVGELQQALRRIAQIQSKIDQLDKAKSIPLTKKEVRKLHDGLIKYCKNRDPGEDLLCLDYKVCNMQE